MAIAMNRLRRPLELRRRRRGSRVARRRFPTAIPRTPPSSRSLPARFGVTSRYLSSAIEIQIKMAQGAKPGEGGHLPGKKVYPWIAEVRRSYCPGIGLISPPPHHDIYSIEDLAELIFDLKNANPGARVSVKLCLRSGRGHHRHRRCKGRCRQDLRSLAITAERVLLRAIPSGMLVCRSSLVLPRLSRRCCKTACAPAWCLRLTASCMDGTDVAVTCLLGAEEFGFATMPLIAMGCLMQRDCQQDTCPAGIATQNCRLRGVIPRQARVR